MFGAQPSPLFFGDSNPAQIRATPEEYVSYEVLDPRYKRIGSVKKLLVNAGKELEYIRVRVGLLDLKSVLIPVQSV